jgi:hypothetical protein
MRNGRSFAASAGATVLALSVVTPSLGEEPVSLSRYVVTLTTPPAVGLDQATLQALCRDDDGCELVLTRTTSPDDPATARSGRTRLFLSPTNEVWFTSDGAAGTDGNPTGEYPIIVASACVVADGTPSGDDFIGFGLISTSAGQTCRLVVND